MMILGLYGDALVVQGPQVNGEDQLYTFLDYYVNESRRNIRLMQGSSNGPNVLTGEALWARANYVPATEDDGYIYVTKDHYNNNLFNALEGDNYLWDAADQIDSAIHRLHGGKGDDIIYGGEDGNDLISGGNGNDTLQGGAGDDTYLVGDNDGNNLIINNQTGNGSDTLRFTGTVSYAQLWFKQEGNDLVIDVVGGDTVVTLDDWYSNTEDQVDQIETSDGYVLTKNNVNQLVAAMARYEAPALDAQSLASEVQQGVIPTITANWQQ